MVDKDNILYSATTIRADMDILLNRHIGKLSAGKLAALIGIEDLGCGRLYGLLQGRKTECSIHGGCSLPHQTKSAALGHNGHQVDKVMEYVDAGDIHTPDPNRMVDEQVAQKV